MRHFLKQFFHRAPVGNRFSEAFIKVAHHEGGPYHIETSPLICSANQWTGVYMIGTSLMQKLLLFQFYCFDSD